MLRRNGLLPCRPDAFPRRVQCLYLRRIGDHCCQTFSESGKYDHAVIVGADVLSKLLFPAFRAFKR